MWPMTKEEVAECLVHLMPYIGVPKTLAAMRCWKAFTGEDEQYDQKIDAIAIARPAKRQGGWTNLE